MCCSSGPAGPRAGIGSLGLPAGGEAILAHPGPALLPHAPELQDLRWETWKFPPHRGRGSTAAPVTGLDVRVLSGLSALPAPTHPGFVAASRSRHFPSAPHLTSFGSRPVSLRIFSSTFFKLSLAFSSCSCKVLTATAIFSLQQAPRLLSRPRLLVSRRETRED